MKFILSVILFFACFFVSLAQEPPPHPINVTWTGQNLSFGAFYIVAVGGSVTINSDGSRAFSGDVVLLGLGIPFSTALYRITGHRGTVVSLLNGPDVFLNGSGGGSMRLHIGASNPVSPFVLSGPPLMLNVGGTLTVGNSGSNPPGNYSGTFDMTFVQE